MIQFILESMAYDESNVKSLSSVEHIRQRPGMYIGRLGDGSHPDDGIYILLKEVIDNAVDEFIMGSGNRIEVTILDDTVTVRDYGRGIPLGKVVECVSVINTGAKYDSSAFQFSVGLNGVGTKAVNALSSSFTVTSYREGKGVTAAFSEGKLKKKTNIAQTAERTGTLVSFHPDVKLFPGFHYDEELVLDRLWNYAYLNSGLTIVYNKRAIKSSNGLKDMLSKVIGSSASYPVIYSRNQRIEFAFTHSKDYGESYFSYVNGQHTTDGGTHLAAFKEGVLKGINEFFGKSWNAPEIRDGIVAAVAVKVQNPVFESQTKNKLGSTDVRWIVNDVKEAILDTLLKNKDIAKGVQEKITTNEKVHKEVQAVRNSVKERSKKGAVHIPKLRDCRYHLDSVPASHRKDAENSMIFLTEGDSAAGTLSNVRNADTQAVFALRGKPFNVQGFSKTEVYKHDELYNIMVALGIENDIDNLRYAKVVIATDADTDGFHIRILLMTYFLSYFRELVTSGRLYILETPLFRVRNKLVTEYCYSEQERDEAMKRIKGAEVTRFKGLGEISPNEFKRFIGEDIKLLPVSITSFEDIEKQMAFYMGSNTPQRRDFIMENLLNVTG